MRCEEVLARAADLDGRAERDPEVVRHLAACASCREALDDARSGLAAFASYDADGAAPPADSGAAWNAAHAPRARPLVWAARAAVLLLAVAGALALSGVELRTAPPAAPGLSRADVQASVHAAIARLAERLAAADAARGRELASLADAVTERRREDTDAVLTELAAIRRDVTAIRFVQASMLEAAAPPMPSLPDPR